jgi:uncharacterized protein
MSNLFFKRRYIWVPSLLGWLMIIALMLFIGWMLLLNTYPFLAKQKPGHAKILVVEGWIPDHGLRNAIDYYYDNNYEIMVVTGVPITQWTFSSPFANMAEASVESMKRLFFRDTIYTATIPNTVLRDRTYGTAVALKMELEKWNFSQRDFDLYTMGAHARRSHLMYEKVFNDGRQIGLITDTDPSFDASSWYKTSRGFRIVFSELISYFYSAVFFHPDIEHYKANIINGRYVDKLVSKRYEKDRYFADSLSSPLNKNDLQRFRGLKYFQPDKKYKIQAYLEPDSLSEIFTMPTTTERQPRYRKYGTLHFEIDDQKLQLSIFQNVDQLEKNPAYNSLFLPFKDLTNKDFTYGGGRYLDLEIPKSDSLIIDFNLCYNPYCAYDERWSCPLTPLENYLEVPIFAGEKKYP